MIWHLGRSIVSSSSPGSRSEVDVRYAIVIEKAGNNFSGYAPDLPGCVATGATVKETESVLREAINFHLAGLREDGAPIPQPSSRVDYVDVAV
jgi:predicted RNase H-like HicB family nuclease